MEMSVKEHYDSHLGRFYSWMTGDFENNQRDFQEFLVANKMTPRLSGKVLDLGAGHGIQSVSLAKIGFSVTALDFNDQLLEELRLNSQQLSVEARNADIRLLEEWKDLELIVCAGDTLSHLEDKNQVWKLLRDTFNSLSSGGKLLLSFRDQSAALPQSVQSFLVKEDEGRKLTCKLEFEEEMIRVTDILEEKAGNNWNESVSSYYKVLLRKTEMIACLENSGFGKIVDTHFKGMVVLIAEKP
jgi:2-polyprenyl-3-methyl-5-hydroxy-6-metoxy-1,4-benzoquinol methylase